MPIQSNTPPVQRGTGGKRVHLAAALVVATLGLRSEFSLATESTGAPAMAPVAAPSSVWFMALQPQPSSSTALTSTFRFMASLPLTAGANGSAW